MKLDELIEPGKIAWEEATKNIRHGDLLPPLPARTSPDLPFFILQYRFQKDWTQQQLATKMGISGAAVVSTWETGRIKPGSSSYRKLEDLFKGTTKRW